MSVSGLLRFQNPDYRYEFYLTSKVTNSNVQPNIQENRGGERGHFPHDSTPTWRILSPHIIPFRRCLVSPLPCIEIILSFP
jgi:hypothetical protein